MSNELKQSFISQGLKPYGHAKRASGTQQLNRPVDAHPFSNSIYIPGQQACGGFCCFAHEGDYSAGMDDDAWKKQKKQAKKQGDAQFNKYEKLATLGDHLTLAEDQCIKPPGSPDQ